MTLMICKITQTSTVTIRICLSATKAKPGYPDLAFEALSFLFILMKFNRMLFL